MWNCKRPNNDTFILFKLSNYQKSVQLWLKETFTLIDCLGYIFISLHLICVHLIFVWKPWFNHVYCSTMQMFKTKEAFCEQKENGWIKVDNNVWKPSRELTRRAFPRGFLFWEEWLTRWISKVVRLQRHKRGHRDAARGDRCHGRTLSLAAGIIFRQ